MTKQLISAAFAGCLALTGFSSPASADPVFVEIDIAPPRIEDYPHTVYEGRPVYYYEGRWYERRGPRWVYYREEPRPLVVYRSSPEYRRHHAPPPPRRHYEARPSRDRRDDRRDERRDERRHEDHPRHRHD